MLLKMVHVNEQWSMDHYSGFKDISAPTAHIHLLQDHPITFWQTLSQ